MTLTLKKIITFAVQNITVCPNCVTANDWPTEWILKA